MTRREEIAKIAWRLEDEKERIENRLAELYEEDEKLWKEEHFPVSSDNPQLKEGTT